MDAAMCKLLVKIITGTNLLVSTSITNVEHEEIMFTLSSGCPDLAPLVFLRLRWIIEQTMSYSERHPGTEWQSISLSVVLYDWACFGSTYMNQLLYFCIGRTEPCRQQLWCIPRLPRCAHNYSTDHTTQVVFYHCSDKDQWFLSWNSLIHFHCMNVLCAVFAGDPFHFAFFLPLIINPNVTQMKMRHCYCWDWPLGMTHDKENYVEHYKIRALVFWNIYTSQCTSVVWQ